MYLPIYYQLHMIRKHHLSEHFKYKHDDSHTCCVLLRVLFTSKILLSKCCLCALTLFFSDISFIKSASGYRNIYPGVQVLWGGQAGQHKSLFVSRKDTLIYFTKVFEILKFCYLLWSKVNQESHSDCL